MTKLKLGVLLDDKPRTSLSISSRVARQIRPGHRGQTEVSMDEAVTSADWRRNPQSGLTETAHAERHA